MTTGRQHKIPRESENVLRLGEDLALQRLSWVSRPTEIEFGFNNHCNLLCVMCHQADGIPSRVMPAAAARGVLDQILPWALHLTPSDASEPLMNDLDAIIALCGTHDVQMLLYCNGTLLDEPTFRRIAPVTHRIWFSIDSPEKATFEALRVRADFDAVLGNIRTVMPLAAAARIEIGFNAVVMAPNWHQMPALVDLVADLGGTQMSMQELLPNSTGYEELKIDGRVPEDAFGAMVELVRVRAMARGVSVSLHLHQPWGGEIVATPPRQGSKSPLAEIRELHMDSLARMHPGFCPMAMNYAKVTPDGAVYPCCRGPSELEMGNVLHESFESIWNGARYREFRRQMFAGEYPEVCRTCVVLTGPAHFPGNAPKD
ncbi:MAG TPA: radical SAM protein [Planctomycetota bacterium]|nr:radical SAM protein [Planctomycetota bacterium]